MDLSTKVQFFANWFQSYLRNEIILDFKKGELYDKVFSIVKKANRVPPVAVLVMAFSIMCRVPARVITQSLMFFANDIIKEINNSDHSNKFSSSMEETLKTEDAKKLLSFLQGKREGDLSMSAIHKQLLQLVFRNYLESYNTSFAKMNEI